MIASDTLHTLDITFMKTGFSNAMVNISGGLPTENIGIYQSFKSFTTERFKVLNIYGEDHKTT